MIGIIGIFLWINVTGLKVGSGQIPPACPSSHPERGLTLDEHLSAPAQPMAGAAVQAARGGGHWPSSAWSTVWVQR